MSPMCLECQIHVPLELISYVVTSERHMEFCKIRRAKSCFGVAFQVDPRV